MSFASKAKKTAIVAAIACSALLIGSKQGIFSHELRTEIDIDSSPETVWAELVNFESFPNWNPMIRSAEGQPQLGEKLIVFVQAEGADGMEFKPTVTKVDLNRELRWLGTLGVRGVFDGEHIFTLEPTDEGNVHFVHREEFRGVLIPLLMRFIEDDTLRGFNDMNRALKARAEQPV